MKIYLDVTVPEHVENRQVGLKCDLCGRESPSLHDWAAKRYEVCETRVSMKTGSDFPEGGGGEVIEYDICPDCFVTKVLPFLHAQSKTDVNWEKWEF